MAKKKCNHFAVGMVHGKVKLCLIGVLPAYVMEFVRIYWVSRNMPSGETIKKYAKMFTKYKYCPKCGERLDFSEVEKLYEK